MKTTDLIAYIDKRLAKLSEEAKQNIPQNEVFAEKLGAIMELSELKALAKLSK